MRARSTATSCGSAGARNVNSACARDAELGGWLLAQGVLLSHSWRPCTQCIVCGVGCVPHVVGLSVYSTLVSNRSASRPSQQLQPAQSSGLLAACSAPVVCSASAVQVSRPLCKHRFSCGTIALSSSLQPHHAHPAGDHELPHPPATRGHMCAAMSTRSHMRCNILQPPMATCVLATTACSCIGYTSLITRVLIATLKEGMQAAKQPWLQGKVR
jgi:hypothetical protein